MTQEEAENMSGVVYLGTPCEENIVGHVDEKGVMPIKGKCEMSEEDIKQAVKFHNIMVNALNQGVKIELKCNYELDKNNRI